MTDKEEKMRREHIVDGKPCWCGPRAQREGESIIWVHRELPPCPGCAGATAVAEAGAEPLHWAQAALTALNVGDVRSGSLLHLKLREVMVAYRARLAALTEQEKGR